MNANDELLTNEEMSALLPEGAVGEAAKERERRKRIIPYNFRRPDRLSKEQVRSLYLLHDLFAHALSSSLPLFLRAVSEVNLISVEQQSYGDYLRGLSDPTTIFTVTANALRGLFAFEINSSIAFPVIDRMLGGEGKELTEKRPATDLELKVLEGFLTVIVENYREVWRSVLEFETEVIGRETRPQLLQIVPPNEIVATIVYQVQIGDSKGLMSICLPVGMLEPVIADFNKSSYSADNTISPEETNSLLKTVSLASFPLTSELDKVPAAVSDLMELSVGDVIRTNHSVEKPVNICIAESVKFVGSLGSYDRNLVVQLTDSKSVDPKRTTAQGN
ncbi:MAG: flagellar motor switch protein FliM [Acidobacteriota bacterium]